MSAPSERDLPLVSVAPGFGYDELARRSTMPLDPPRPAGRALAAVQPDGPHRLRIDHPALGFELPAGRFTLIQLEDGVVVEIRATPQLDYLPLDGAIALCRRIEASARAAGWRRVLPEGDAPIDPAIDDDAALAAVLHGGEWTAALKLRRVHEQGDPLARQIGFDGDAWLVTATVTSRDAW